MRPQHITAENVRGGPITDRDRAASMRPQHITAENVPAVARPPEVAGASMRPQHITAENGLRVSALASRLAELQ